MNRQRILVALLWLSAGYLVLDALYHFSGFRVQDTYDWPAAARSFAVYMSWLWASFALFMAGVLASMARFSSVRRGLALPVAAWAVFHAGVVTWWGAQNLPVLWSIPSLVFWTPYFGWILRAEAAGLVAFAVLLVWESRVSAAGKASARAKRTTEFAK